MRNNNNATVARSAPSLSTSLLVGVLRFTYSEDDIKIIITVPQQQKILKTAIIDKKP